MHDSLQLSFERLCGYIAADPDNLELIASIADAGILEGREAEALPHIERALRLSPGHPQFTYRRAVALRRCGRGDEALDLPVHVATVAALRATCDNLTRQGVMDAVNTIFKDYQGPLNLPGVTTTLSPTDHLATETMRLLKATLLADGKGKWEYFGDLISFVRED